MAKMKTNILSVIVLGWAIAHTNVWCADDPGMISDTAGEEPYIILESCQQKCLDEGSCNFMFFGIEAYSCTEGFEDRCERYGIKANRCALFKTCDMLTYYSGGNPSIYRLIKGEEKY